jgi:hypothetical protein
MHDVIFEAENNIRRHANPKLGFITLMCINYSYGLIRTKQQATRAQIIVIVLAILIIGYRATEGPSPMEKPSQDLINRLQPTKAL